MIRRPPRSPLFPYPPLFRSLANWVSNELVARIGDVEPQQTKLDAGSLARLVAMVSAGDRKSTRLNSSHSQISYAVFCLKKKKDAIRTHRKKARAGGPCGQER